MVCGLSVGGASTRVLNGFWAPLVSGGGKNNANYDDVAVESI